MEGLDELIGKVVVVEYGKAIGILTYCDIQDIYILKDPYSVEDFYFESRDVSRIIGNVIYMGT